MPRTHRLIVVLSLLITTLPCWGIEAQSDGVLITGAWARPTAIAREPEAEVVGGVSAAYMTIENQSARAIRLMDVSSTVAEIVELHQTSSVDDVMQMRLVEDGITIPVQGQVSLEPGGYHIMLMNLKNHLIPGDAIALRLLFEVQIDTGQGSSMQMVHIGVPVLEQEPDLHAIVVDNAWVRPTVFGTEQNLRGGERGGSVSAAYMTLFNRSDNDKRLIAARTTVADTTKIHQTAVDGDVIRIRPVDNVGLTAGGAIHMEPGGLHIALFNLPDPLVPGDAILVTLVFESGEEMDVAVPVFDAQAPEYRGIGYD